MVYGKSVDLFLGRIVLNEGSVCYKSNAGRGVPWVTQKSELSRHLSDNKFYSQGKRIYLG